MTQFTANPPIVVGVDGSEHAAQAIRWAAQEARLHNAPLTLVHAVDIPDVYAGVLPPTPKVLDAVRSRGEDVLADAEQLARRLTDTAVDTVIRDGHPVVVLRDAARTGRMLVLGAAGHGRLTETLMLGSTVAQLAGHAGKTVVVVRGEQADQVAGQAPVVVGVDGSPVSEAALATAFDEASFRRAPLLAVHAWTASYLATMYPSTPVIVDWEPTADVEERLFAERMAGWSEKYPEVNVERRMVNERAKHALLELSDRAQLLVVGSRGHGGFAGLLLGSTSQALAYHARCPVMIVRPDDAPSS